MVDEHHLPEAVVFYARDFLADEFPRLARCWPDRKHVYITANERERARIRAIDPEGDVLDLYNPAVSASAPMDRDADIALNADRYLRYASATDLAWIAERVRATCDAILSRYRVRFYLDEPVSGYPNWEFNRTFRAAGALCLHFQASWIPGYLFFTSDPAQNDPVPVGVTKGGQAIVTQHIAARNAGQARPLYVIGYDRLGKRLGDIATTAGKAAYRMLFRRKAPYIDRDPSAHVLHTKALIASLGGHYATEVDPAGRLLVFPLHFEPEAVLSYFGKYGRQDEIAARLHDSLPAGWKLVLKEHPSQPGALGLAKWQDLRRSKRVILLRGDYPAGRLLPIKPTVVSIGSTFALEAALAGCPVGLIGGAHFAPAPGIQSLAAPEDWRSLPDASSERSEELATWYGAFLDRYCFKANMMRGMTQFEDMAGLVAALESSQSLSTEPERLEAL